MEAKFIQPIHKLLWKPDLIVSFGHPVENITNDDPEFTQPSEPFQVSLVIEIHNF